MTKKNTCLPCISSDDAPMVSSYNVSMGIEATAYNKPNWFAKNGVPFFYGTQFTGNVAFLAYAIMEKDIYTGLTASFNLLRNGYGIVSSQLNKNKDKDKSRNEKTDAWVMGAGVASNSIQALSFLGGGGFLDSAVGTFATVTYGLRLGAHFLRKAGRKKETNACKDINALPIAKETDPLHDFLDKKSEILEGLIKGSKNIESSKKKRMRAYNLEKLASTFFVSRGVMQFAAGFEKGNNVGMGTGVAFIVGAFGMLRGDFSKRKSAKERCFFANTESLVQSFNDGCINKRQQELNL